MLQVGAMGYMLVPDLFLMIVIYRVLTGEFSQASVSWWIWGAFVGGMIWDLRWAVSPGMSAVVNATVVYVAYLIWSRTPSGGRSPVLFALIAIAGNVISGLAHYLIWAVPSQAALRMFFAQQFFSIPLLIILFIRYVVVLRRGEKSV